MRQPVATFPLRSLGGSSGAGSSAPRLAVDDQRHWRGVRLDRPGVLIMPAAHHHRHGHGGHEGHDGHGGHEGHEDGPATPPEREQYVSLPGGRRLPRFEMTGETLLDRTLIAYGPSKTGKTTILKHAMSLLQGLIDQVVVVSPSESQNRSFEGTVPPQAIHYSIGVPGPRLPPKRAAEQFLETVWRRQEAAVATMRRASRVPVLRRLARRLAPGARATCEEVAQMIEGRRAAALAAVDRRAPLAERQAKEREVGERFDTAVSCALKKALEPARAALLARDDLDTDERYSLEYLFFNPRLLLIFDDCAAELKAMCKTPIFKNIFYRARHAQITPFICCQDDTDLDANLRKNAFLSIFTTGRVARSNFTRRSNNFSEEDVQTVEDAIPAIYAGGSHRKLAYIRDDPAGQNFYFYDPLLMPAFRFGSRAFWDLCASVARGDGAVDSNNEFFSAYAVGSDRDALRPGLRPDGGRNGMDGGGGRARGGGRAGRRP